jgi:Cft2 family RNA processing exonuclease
MIGEFCKTVVDTTKQGGNVLVPCFPSGIVYDLFECLASQVSIYEAPCRAKSFWYQIKQKSLVQKF